MSFAARQTINPGKQIGDGQHTDCFVAPLGAVRMAVLLHRHAYLSVPVRFRLGKCRACFLI